MLRKSKTLSCWRWTPLPYCYSISCQFLLYIRSYVKNYKTHNIQYTCKIQLSQLFSLSRVLQRRLIPFYYFRIHIYIYTNIWYNYNTLSAWSLYQFNLLLWLARGSVSPNFNLTFYQSAVQLPQVSKSLIYFFFLQWLFSAL